MTTTRKLLLGVGVLIGVGLAWLILRSGERREPSSEPPSPTTQQFPRGRRATNESASRAGTNRLASALKDFPQDERRPVQLFYAFARATMLYNVDPSVTGYREVTNRFGHVVTFETRTHIVEVVNGKLVKVVSAMDGSNPPHDRDNEGIKTWYQCSGTLSEEAAIEEALGTLRKLNDVETLAAITTSRRDFQSEPITVPEPGGRKVRVAPFPTVRFYDSNDVLRLKVEYRVGPTGVVGITDWFNNR